MKLRKSRHLTQELFIRETGVNCPWWSNIRALRHTILGPRRCWKMVSKLKENSLIELNSDLMWITKPAHFGDGKSSVMFRICQDGHRMPLYKMNTYPRPKDIITYDIPHPVYQSTLPRHEYRPVLCSLRKGNLLTRHDLETGEVYNHIHLGSLQSQYLTPCFMQDMLIVQSPKLKFEYRPECFFHFDVFQMHPFALLASFNIDGIVFPAEEHRQKYGKLRRAEIQDGMLIVMTDKNYSLIYNAQEIIEAKRVSRTDGSGEESENPGQLVTETPPLLFVSYAHTDILGIGACPWAYIHAVSDYILEVRDLQTHDLLEGGRVTWRDYIGSDYLMFFPDDSNRLIRVKRSELRVLAILEGSGKRTLTEVFRYPEKKKITRSVTTNYSRSGRLIKSKYEFDDSSNRAISFNIDTDLMILVILEAKEDIEHNCINLVKVTLYDSITYEYLQELKIGVKIDGDIDMHHLCVHIDRDMLNIVSQKGFSFTGLFYRLYEIRKRLEKQSSGIVCSDGNSGNESSDADSESLEGEDRAANRSQRNRVSTRNRRNRESHPRAARKRRLSQQTADPDANSDDEWVP